MQAGLFFFPIQQILDRSDQIAVYKEYIVGIDLQNGIRLKIFDAHQIFQTFGKQHMNEVRVDYLQNPRGTIRRSGQVVFICVVT